ncbi:hypothetical protein JDV02_002681 [Purpureocillium takamizusanense]|uniref:Uncharacterized protein n=1 Tax=Purpureocillium takamizusanense TaxID=2060973 RepID=A0A9Q8V926_9HYPO|nr:uncharacterized protein JDV02_002681 [Purpureocillium takamizusanense]UNI16221.1 hypothetical protein JDV02_002681 [Purpureocillium takamizusanense]
MSAPSTGPQQPPQQLQQQQRIKDTVKAVRAALRARARQSALSIRRLGVPRTDRMVPILQAINAARFGAPGVRYRLENNEQPPPTRDRRVFPRPHTRFVIDTVYPFNHRQTPLRPEQRHEEDLDTAATQTTFQATTKHRRQHKELVRKATTQTTLIVPGPATPAVPQPPTEPESDTDEDAFTIEPASAPPTTDSPSSFASHVATEPTGSRLLVDSQSASVPEPSVTPATPASEPSSSAASGQASSSAPSQFDNQQANGQINLASQPATTEFAPSLPPLPSYLSALRAFGSRPNIDARRPQPEFSEQGQPSNTDDPQFVVTNGIRTRKRRANTTTDLELVAAAGDRRIPTPQRIYLARREARLWANSARAVPV